MKKIFKGLAALAIFGAFNLGLTTDAQATEISLINSGEANYFEIYRPPRRYKESPPHHHGHVEPPPHHYHGYGAPPPPPPDYYDHNPPHHHDW